MGVLRCSKNRKKYIHRISKTENVKQNQNGANALNYRSVHLPHIKDKKDTPTNLRLLRVEEFVSIHNSQKDLSIGNWSAKKYRW